MKRDLASVLQDTLNCLKEMDRHLSSKRDTRDFGAGEVILQAELALEHAKNRPVRQPFRVLRHRRLPAFLLAVLLATGCGPGKYQTCQVTFVEERQLFGATKCGVSELLIGVAGDVLTCAKAVASCPKE